MNLTSIIINVYTCGISAAFHLQYLHSGSAIFQHYPYYNTLEYKKEIMFIDLFNTRTHTQKKMMCLRLVSSNLKPQTKAAQERRDLRPEGGISHSWSLK